MHANERLIRSLLTGVADPERRGVRDLQSPDLVIHFPGHNQLTGDHHGPDGAAAFNAVLRERSGGTLRFDVHDVLGSDAHAVTIFTAHAERAGRAYSWRGASVYRIEDGLLCETWIHPFEMDAVDAFVGPPQIEGSP